MRAPGLLSAAVLGLSLLTLPGRAAAPTPSEPEAARALVARAVQHFDNGVFRASRELLLRARGRTGERQLLGEIHLYLGLIEAVENRPESARRLFRQALLEKPELRVDPVRFKPALVELFESVRRELEGVLRVESRRGDLRVWLDGVPQAAPPMQCRLAPGVHQVEARDGRGAEVFKGSVQIVAGRTVVLALGAGGRPAPPPGPAASEARPPRRRVWTWVSGATAVAALGAAIGLAASAQSDYESACNLLAGPGLPCSERRSLVDPGQRGHYREVHDQMQLKGLAANICFSVAGALAATSVVLFFVEGRRASEPRAAARVRWAPPLTLQLRY